MACLRFNYGLNGNVELNVIQRLLSKCQINFKHDINLCTLRGATDQTKVASLAEIVLPSGHYSIGFSAIVFNISAKVWVGNITISEGSCQGYYSTKKSDVSSNELLKYAGNACLAIICMFIYT